MANSFEKLKSTYEVLESFGMGRRGRVVARGERDIPNDAQEDEGLSYGKITKWASPDGVKYYPSENTVKKIPEGEYEIKYDSGRNSFYFKKFNTDYDQLILLPDSASEEIINEIDKFWSMEEAFRQYGYLWKRGMLLYGPPGSGKSCTVQIICKKLVYHGGVVVYASNSPDDIIAGLNFFRNIEPTRPLIIVLEDIEAMIERFGESELLSLLDGEFQVDNIVFIATTNYPEKLDRRIINRPSRFDMLKYVGMPQPTARKTYIETTLERANDSVDNIDEWVEKTQGFSIAHLKELIVFVRIFGVTLDEGIERVQKLIKSKPSSSSFNDEEIIESDGEQKLNDKYIL